MNDYKIYPKQFKNVKIPIEKNRCFFIMPFAKEFDIVYGELKSLLGEDGYICTRVDEISGSTPIINKILTELLRAQFVIVDLTNCNPNVFYELGIAHTFKDAENIFLLSGVLFYPCTTHIRLIVFCHFALLSRQGEAITQHSLNVCNPL